MRCATLPPQGIKSGREGGNPFFYPPVTQKLKRMSPAPLLWRPRPCVTWPGGFPLCQSGAVCGLCRASIVVGRSVGDTRVRWRRCGHPVLPSRQPRSSGRSTAQVSRSPPSAPVCRARQAAASLAPLYPRLIARLVWMHGTARCRGICDYGGLPCS